jgi:hypothetical protein
MLHAVSPTGIILPFGQDTQSNITQESIDMLSALEKRNVHVLSIESEVRISIYQRDCWFL